jgi:hypothetical protein
MTEQEINTKWAETLKMIYDLGFLELSPDELELSMGIQIEETLFICADEVNHLPTDKTIRDEIAKLMKFSIETCQKDPNDMSLTFAYDLFKDVLADRRKDLKEVLKESNEISHH